MRAPLRLMAIDRHRLTNLPLARKLAATLALLTGFALFIATWLVEVEVTVPSPSRSCSITTAWKMSLGAGSQSSSQLAPTSSSRSGEREIPEAVVRAGMGGAVPLTVPLDVSVGVGRTWEDAGH